MANIYNKKYTKMKDYEKKFKGFINKKISINESSNLEIVTLETIGKLLHDEIHVDGKDPEKAKEVYMGIISKFLDKYM